MSKIEWTGKTWNPVVGCSIHSAGCRGCYAMKDAYRLMHNPNAKVAAKFAGTARMVNGHAVWTGKLNFSESALLEPLRRRTPTTWFVNSMSDLFHEDMPAEWIDRIFAVMALCPQHTFQVLTKRADGMRAYLADPDQPHRMMQEMCEVAGSLSPHHDYARDFAEEHADERQFNPLPNVWLGVSVEDQAAADARIPDLLATPAAVRFLSCEPLLGPLNLSEFLDANPGTVGTLRDASRSGDCRAVTPGEAVAEGVAAPSATRIDWVICGGESGPRARPMHPDWARGLRDQCAAGGVPFFFKQWGAFAPSGPGVRPIDYPDCAGQVAWPDGSVTIGGNPADHGGTGHHLFRGTKAVTGRLLDGVEHLAMPA